MKMNKHDLAKAEIRSVNQFGIGAATVGAIILLTVSSGPANAVALSFLTLIGTGLLGLGSLLLSFAFLVENETELLRHRRPRRLAMIAQNFGTLLALAAVGLFCSHVLGTPIAWLWPYFVAIIGVGAACAVVCWYRQLVDQSSLDHL